MKLQMRKKRLRTKRTYIWSHNESFEIRIRQRCKIEKFAYACKIHYQLYIHIFNWIGKEKCNGSEKRGKHCNRCKIIAQGIWHNVYLRDVCAPLRVVVDRSILKSIIINRWGRSDKQWSYSYTIHMLTRRACVRRNHTGQASWSAGLGIRCTGSSADGRA